MWKGGAAMRYGGNLPESDWLHCCQAYIHVRNRLPNIRTQKIGGKTPYEIFNDIEISIFDQLDHLRTIGCLCYVVLPHSRRTGKPKVSYRAVMLGYSDAGGQKGYRVRRLDNGKVKNVARERVYKFFETHFPYPKPANYDACLKKYEHKHDGVSHDHVDVDAHPAYHSDSDATISDENDSDSKYAEVARDIHHDDEIQIDSELAIDV